MPAQDFDVADRVETSRDCGDAPRRKGEWIAPRHYHFPNIGDRRDIIKGTVQRLRREHSGFSRSHRLSTKTETAIDRAETGKLQENAIAIAMDDSLDRAVARIADRIGLFVRARGQLRFGGHELSRNRIIGI